MTMRRTDEYLALDRHSVWHPFTRHSAALQEDFPVIVRGEGSYLFDNDGNGYVDAISSWWCCNLGHSHPRLVQAIQRQAEHLQHSILGNMSHPAVVELASRLVGFFPGAERRVLFASDGACAVEAALRVAVQYWHNLGQVRKCRFVALKEGYHGDTLGAMSLGFMPDFHVPYRDIVMPVHRVDRPCCAGCAWNEEPESCHQPCLDELRQVLERHHAELAGLVVEPHCQGAAGMRMYAPACLREMARLAQEYRVIFIVDEIAMGFGRTGRMFSFEHAGVDPDIVCLGKGLSGGYLPVSAAVVKKSLFDTFTDTPEDHTLYHGHTFAGNPLGTAAALACLEVYEDEQIVEQARVKGELLAREFAVFRELEGVCNVRCLGLISAFDLAVEKGDLSASALAQVVRREMRRQGVLLRPLGNVLYLMPPLTIGAELLQELVRKLYATVRNVISGRNGFAGG